MVACSASMVGRPDAKQAGGSIDQECTAWQRKKKSCQRMHALECHDGLAVYIYRLRHAVHHLQVDRVMRLMPGSTWRHTFHHPYV